MKGHIRLLPVHVANQIAAGEVVERPASVVKELMENALDAGATAIEIDITEGGRKRIGVSDNGSGMGRDDALMSIERQATSKIGDVDDIARIATLGFRGEALAAIASVSRFQLQSCRQGESVGTEVLIADGRIREVRDIGAPQGTSIQVRDLFYNVPARRKFMRTQATELAHIRTVFSWYALAYPECLLTLRIDGREAHRLAGGATPADRIRDLYGAEVLAALQPLDWQGGDIRIRGYVAPPAWSRRDHSEQYIFVNRRPSSAPVIAYALRQAYAFPEAARRPMVFLFIELPVDRVDVNVHPTKREVRFRQASEVRDAVIEAIRTVVGGNPAPERCEPTPASVPDPLGAGAAPPPPTAWQAWALAVDRPPAGSASPASDATSPASATDPAASAVDSPPPDRHSPWSWFRMLGQIGKRYLLLETDGGYVTLDPRAAHERVLYERLIGHADAAGTAMQALLIPQTVKLAPRDAHTLRRHLDHLRKLGFGVEDFGDDHFKVDALPDFLVDTPCRELLVALAEDLSQPAPRSSTTRQWHEPIARAASRSAVSASRALSPEEWQRLINDLAACRMPYTCPRGRPTMVFTSLRELDRKFGRD